MATESTAPNLVIADLKPGLNITLVQDNSGLALLRDFFQRETVYGFDTETNVAKKFHERKLRTIQIGNRTEQYVIDLLAFAGTKDAMLQQGGRVTLPWMREVADTLCIGLESNTHVKVGTSLQFDYEMCYWNLGIRARNFHDCLLAEKVIYAGRVHFKSKGFWALDDMVARYCNLTISKEEQKGFDLETPLTQAQIEYAALDTRLPLSIKKAQDAIIEKAGLGLTVMIENKAIPPFGDMRLNGIYLNEGSWLAQVEKVKEQHVANLAELDKHFVTAVGDRDKPPPPIDGLEEAWRNEKEPKARATLRQRFQARRKMLAEWKKASIKWEGQAAINYGSPKQVLEGLNKMGLKLKDSNDKTLDLHAGTPVIDSLRKFRGTEKMLDVYGETFLKHIDTYTGRVHSRLDQLGAETGRTSSTDPNIQNIPKESDYRNAFMAREGYRFCGIDWDGCELRLIAEDSGEEAWIVAFNKGEDVHSICALLMNEVAWNAATENGCSFLVSRTKCSCKGHKKLRDDAKAVNFGIVYGMEARALAVKLGISVKAAESLLRLHAFTFPKIWACLKRLGDSAKQTLECRTMAGRRRLFTKPTWDKARERAKEKAIEKGQNPNLVDSKAIGRVYYAQWGSIEREGKNTRFQGSNADLLKVALGLAWEEFEPIYGGILVNEVHDEVDFEAPTGREQSCCDFMRSKMEEAGTWFVKRVTMTASATIADCWQKG